MSNMLKAVVTADTRRFQAGMRRVSLSSAKAAKVSKEEMASLQGNLDMIGMAATAVSAVAVAAFAAITASVVKLGKEAITAAKKYETLALAFKLSGGTDKDFKDLIEFADRTPFEADKLAQYGTQLRNVTTGLYGTTQQMKQMAGALAKAQMLGKDQAFVNSLGRIISAFQTGSGQIKRYTQTLLNTGAISAKTAIDIKNLSKAGGSAADVIALLTKEFRKSQQAAWAFSQTAEGLESTLRSRKMFTLAGLGGDKALAAYKLVLKEISTILLGMRDTKAFKQVNEALEEFNAQLFFLIKSDDFKAFVLDVLTIAAALTKAAAAIVAAVAALSRNKDKMALPGKIGTGIDMYRAFTGFGGDPAAEVAKMDAAGIREYKKMLDDIKKEIEITNDKVNPERSRPR